MMKWKLLSLTTMALLTLGCAEVEMTSHLIKTSLADQKPMGKSYQQATYHVTQKQGVFKVGNPYKIKGTTYTPRESYTHDETGIASWYGPNFHGKPTANGEVFNQHALTAAHRTLQMPSLVRVTNLENGRSVIVRVNDRGPFSKNRVIDMSSKAADLLDMKAQGTARVRVQVLAKESKILAHAAKSGQPIKKVQLASNQKHNNSPSANQPIQLAGNVTSQELPPLDQNKENNDGTMPMPLGNIPTIPAGETISVAGSIDQAGNFMPSQNVTQTTVVPTKLYVQVGAFSDANNAARLSNQLSSIGNVQISQVQVNGTNFNRVRVGPLNDVAQADAMLDKIIDNGFNTAQIIVD